jgi:hypothetical protein
LEIGPVHLHAHGKHEKADPHLAQKAQRLQRGGSKDNLEGMGREPPKERRSEQNASHHFSDHRRLPTAGENPAHEIGGCNDNKELKEKAAEWISCVLFQPLLYRLTKRRSRT